MSNTPKIRFSGFTEDWGQRKLGDISSLITKGTTPKDKSGNGDVNFIKVENINDFSGDIVGMSKISLEEHQGYLKRSQLQEGDILFSIAGTLGRVTSVNKAILPANTNQALSIIRLKEGNLEYVKTCLKGNVVADFIRRNPTIGAQPNLSLEQVSNLEIEIPSEAEQEKIGACFQSLDHLITLHQRKYDDTKLLKKYMLQKMFPQNGQKVPEIRFSEFTGDWEQRKLGEVFEQTSNLVNPKEDEIELWSLTVEDGLTKKSDRYNREFLVKKDDNFKEVRPGDIVYNPMNMTLGAVGYNGMAKSVAVSGYYTTMVTKENYDTYYINTWLKSPQAIQLYRTYATGSLIEKQRVQFPTLSIIPVAFPKYEEQTKIGSYFDSLENLITLHQRKCDELQELKKYMLQNMFPQKG